jgi:hypothetical protein
LSGGSRFARRVAAWRDVKAEAFAAAERGVASRVRRVRTTARAAPWMLALLLAACAPAAVAPERMDADRAAAARGAPPPASYFAALARRGEPVLHIAAAHSLVVVEVQRAGPFARFGHDHVVASHALRRDVAPREGRADIAFDLESLVVDEADLRAAAGFNTKPSPADIEGTRNNLFSRVLRADAHLVSAPLHFHGLVIDGVLDAAAGGLVFHAASGLDAHAVAQVQAQVRRRLLRGFVRRGLLPAYDAQAMAQ